MDDRFLVLLDILGFKELVATETLLGISAKIRHLLEQCEEWADGQTKFGFDTIHFSDTVLLYTKEPGFYSEWFNDLVYIASRVCCSMFAVGIPVRGAMTYGSFHVEASGRHNIYIGQALIDAHEAEKNSGHTMGFRVTSPTWRRQYPAATALRGAEELGIGLVQGDDSLLVNFFTEFIGLDKRQLAHEAEHFFEYPGESDNPWLRTELQAFRFIRDTARGVRASPNDRVRKKYEVTVEFIRRVFGEHLFEVTSALADEYVQSAPTSPSDAP